MEKANSNAGRAGEIALFALQDARDRMNDVRAALDRSARKINKTGHLVELSVEAVKRSHNKIARGRLFETLYGQSTTD